MYIYHFNMQREAFGHTRHRVSRSNHDFLLTTGIVGTLCYVSRYFWFVLRIECSSSKGCKLTRMALAVQADCECGYVVASTPSKFIEQQRYTELIESNFLTIQDISKDTDWRIQQYASKYRRPFGRNATAANVKSNPLVDNATLSGPGVLGGPAGLQLWVTGGPPVDDLVNTAELATARKDILYGSFRTAVRLTPMNGTCSALFSVSTVIPLQHRHVCMV